MAVLKLSSPTLPERSNMNTMSSDTSHTGTKIGQEEEGRKKERKRERKVGGRGKVVYVNRPTKNK